ncbi:uncharacterized protein LOC135483951 [Lineus longissimus]|uniref:uncharacterized protein LOC135483951 n=1 Tax=Lineus longissimus TaxID=88925 RepID=UPI00315D190A
MSEESREHPNKIPKRYPLVLPSVVRGKFKLMMDAFPQNSPEISCFLEARRCLQDVKCLKFCELATKGTGSDGGNVTEVSGARLSIMKEQFTTMKGQKIALLTQLKFTENLIKDNPSCWALGQTEARELFGSVRDSLRKWKETLMELTGQAEELTEVYQQCLEEYEDKKKTLENKLSDLEQKQNRLMGLKQKYNALSQRVDLTDMRGDHIVTKVKELDDTRMGLESGLVSCKDKMECISVAVKCIYDRFADIQKLVHASLEIAENIVSNLEDKLANDKGLYESLSCVCHWKEAISSVRETTVNQDVAIVELTSPDGEEKLKLSMEFKFNEFGDFVLATAHVDDNTVEIGDLVDYAVANDNILHLVKEVQARWVTHRPLLSEISTLQNRFAIDWISEQNTLRMMLGLGGHIVCTLTISDGYPNTGCVELTNVEGFNEDLLLENIKPEQEKPSLTNWLEYLHLQFHTK